MYCTLGAISSWLQHEARHHFVGAGSIHKPLELCPHGAALANRLGQCDVTVHISNA
jgi:hypothetical protein